MDYFYNNAGLPDNESLLQAIDSAAGRLDKKLQHLKLSELGISEYNQKSLGSYIKDIQTTLQINSYILAWSVAHSELPLAKLVFVDYGGGCGIMSLLAKELGIGTVIYNDIYDVSCNDARLIGKAADLEAHAYVCGDIEDLMGYLQKQSISIDAIASSEVIEHIYDIEEYFKKLRLLPSKSLQVAFASSANIHNPFIKRKRMKSQYDVEHNDRKPEWGHKERDSLKSYFGIRKEIIALFAPSLSPDEVEYLARATRGLIKADIEKCVLEFQRTGKISYIPDSSSNTCDPYTGNWNEHLMRMDYIKKILQREGFSVKLRCGYYPFSKHPLKQFVKNVLNGTISFLGENGLVIAPYYMICARR